MPRQTEYQRLINGRRYLGFEVPGQFITIYRADEEYKPLADGFEGVWTIRSETIRWGPRHTLNEVEIRQHFVKQEGATVAEAVRPRRQTTGFAATLRAAFRDFTIPPMSIGSLILAALMLFAGVLLLMDAPELGPLLGGAVFASALALVLFAIVGPFLW
jgi:hypothetical protein